MLNEFKEFAVKGNMLDMAVGIIIGAAFGTVVTSLVNDVVMPPVGMLLGGVDFAEMFMILQDNTGGAPYATLAAAQEAGAITLNYGLFFNAIVSFMIVAFAVFMLVKNFNKLKREQEAPAEPEAPPAPSDEVQLLTQIRDFLGKSA